MDIKHKKTALDDNASLYEKDRNYSGKEYLKTLSGKQKFRYFLDYYWKPLLVIIILLLSVIAVNDCYIVKSEEMAEHLKEYLEIKGKNERVNVEYLDTENYQMQMVFLTRISANDTDLILCSEEDFQTFARQGICEDLKEILPEDMYRDLSSRILEAAYVETDYDGNELSRGPETPYGIDITGSALYQRFEGLGDQLILCVPVNSPNLENALKVISYFTETE